MSTAGVDALLFRLGSHRLAVELHLVSSVLDADEARGMNQLDPRPYLLGVQGYALPDLDRGERVGLLDVTGPPVVLVLGEVLGARTLHPGDMIGLPPWLAAFAPPVIAPACAWVDQNVVWLLNLDTLRKTSLW